MTGVIIVHWATCHKIPQCDSPHCIPDHWQQLMPEPEVVEEPEELTGDWVAGTILLTEEQPFGETTLVPCWGCFHPVLDGLPVTPLRQLSFLSILCVPQCWIVVCGTPDC